MKTIAILSLLILFSGWHVLIAQDVRWELGLESGPSMRNLKVENFLFGEQDFSVAYTAGLSAQYNLSHRWAFLSNLSFERKGTSFTVLFTDQYGNPTETVIMDLNYDYLTVPMLAKVRFGKRIQFFTQTGLYLGVLMQHSFVTPAVGEYPKHKEINNDPIHPFDFGWIGGLGVSLPIKEKLILSFEARGNVGLRNVNKNSYRPDDEVYLRSIGLIIGAAYRFGTTL